MEAAVTLGTRRSSGAASLARFKKLNPEKLKTLRILDVDWPIATLAYLQLAMFVTDAIEVDGAPLIFKCLNNGLHGYERAIGQPDEIRFLAFLDALLCPAIELLSTLVIRAGNEAWRAESGEPLSLWMDTCAPSTCPELQRRKACANAETIRRVLNEFVLGGASWKVVPRVATAH